jgi:hypothetical protein
VEKQVTLKIGRGEKRHPGWANRIDPMIAGGMIKYKDIRFACSCPGTQSGHALRGVSVVSEGWEKVNCKN